MSEAINSKSISVDYKHEVVKVLKNNLHRFKEFGVVEVGLFGSFVRDEATSISDIDLLVAIDNFDFDNFCRLIDFADSLFGGRSVDIVLESNINEINGIYICREVEYVH